MAALYFAFVEHCQFFFFFLLQSTLLVIPHIMNKTRKQTGSGAERYGEGPEAQILPLCSGSWRSRCTSWSKPE